MKTIAFIPVRGGSKSIPLKNIKLFCGNPLVCWSIEALERCKYVDEIIVATDSNQIANIVLSKPYTKIKIYHRLAENANDRATTESVMLEYINFAQLSNDTTFILVQATSPLTETIHFDEALFLYNNGKYDSILTCVRNYRFFWNEDGTSRNYDFKKRPRRQDFSGILMENGAFYISKVENILKSGNRLSGKIGIYEMPEYTGFEIDEPDDWAILETLMFKYVLKKKKKIVPIKLFLCDVDGTLTDGGMYYSEHNDELKKFNTRDGMGFQLLREKGIKIGIITSENTKIVENRAKKLKVDFICQGKYKEGKLEVAMDICKRMKISLSDVAYIGDDINCYNLLSEVGVRACPSDADVRIKNIPNIYVTNRKGGDGCVREFIEEIIQVV